MSAANNIKVLKKNEDLFHEGDESQSMFVIKTGRIAIVKRKGNTDITLAELKPGDLLGEMAFFDKAPRSAGARAAMDKTEVIELPFKNLEAQWANLPAWVKSMVKAVNGHLRRANMRIRQLERTKEEEKEVFPAHTITQLLTILGSVAIRFGEQGEEGLQVPAGILRKYTIQVFQQATHKMNTLCEVLTDFDYMKIEDLGEGRARLIIKDIDFIFNCVEFYNNQLFNESAKKNNINTQQLKTLKVAKHYGEKAEKNAKGFVKINITEIAQVCFKEMGEKITTDGVKALDHTGLLGDHSHDDGNDFIEFDVDYISEIVPYWELIHHLKSYTNDD